MKLNLPRRTKKRVITCQRQPLVAPEAINQMWALDFTLDTLYDGRKFRLLESMVGLMSDCCQYIPYEFVAISFA
jgi:hypothetical protein